MSWSHELETVQRAMEDFGTTLPTVADGFHALHVGAMTDGAIPVKHKELQALAIGITKQCMNCIGFHVQASIDAGANRDEIAETVGVAILMGGGPSYMYGIKALEAYDELMAKAA